MNARSSRGLGLLFSGGILIVLPFVLLWCLPASPEVYVRSIGAVDLMLASATLAAAIVLRVHWRLTGSPAVAWLSVALMAACVERGTLALLRVSWPREVVEHRGWMMLVDIAFVTALLVLITRLRGRNPRVSPLALGAAIGLTASVLQLPIFLADPLPSPPDAALAVANVALVALYVAFAGAVLCLGWPHAWAGVIPCAALLLGVGHAISYSMIRAPFPEQLYIVTNVAAALALSVISMALVYAATSRGALTAATLHDKVALAELYDRLGRERHHEISATVAGITLATQLMHEDGVAPDHKVRLDQMLVAEVERLGRLVDDREAPDEEVLLDEVVGHLALAHRVRGQQVGWTPGEVVYTGRRDQVAEVLTALLTNAADHAPGATVHVHTARRGDDVEIRVTDDGPGVTPTASHTIFEWGRTGDDSRGHGIGLAVARRIAREMGGDLRLVLDPPPTRGASFEMTFPVPGASDPALGAADRAALHPAADPVPAPRPGRGRQTVRRARRRETSHSSAQ